MKQQKALFIKEFKVMSRLYAVPVIIIAGLIIFDCFTTFTRTDKGILVYGPFMMIYVNLVFNLPLIFIGGLIIYALSVERKTGTVYQNMSVPCRRYETVSYKYLVAVLYNLVFSFAAMIMYYLHARESALAKGHEISRVSLDFLLFMDQFTFTFMTIGTACLIWGIVRSVGKLPIFIGISSIFLIGTFLEWFRDKLVPLFDIVKQGNGSQFGISRLIHNQQMQYFDTMYYLAIGLVFATAGLYLYNRFSDV